MINLAQATLAQVAQVAQLTNPDTFSLMFCQDCGSKTAECECGARSRSRERKERERQQRASADAHVGSLSIQSLAQALKPMMKEVIREELAESIRILKLEWTRWMI